MSRRRAVSRRRARAGCLAAMLALAALGCGRPDFALPAMARHDETDRAGLRVVLDSSNQPRITSDLPIRAAACTPACADADQDGLSDAFEDALLVRLRPLLLFHRDDTLFHDPDATLVAVGRVAPWDGQRLLVFYAVLYSRDYGRCDSDGHDGDVERVVVALDLDPAGHAVTATEWYTAAHEGTSYDASRTGLFNWLGPPEVASPVPLDPARAPVWALHVARDKHAAYATLEDCAGRQVSCVDDVCGDLHHRLALPVPVWNAGEPGAPRLDDLADLGFPGECVWCGQRFCGGTEGGAGCPPPIRDKLEAPPFWWAGGAY